MITRIKEFLTENMSDIDFTLGTIANDAKILIEALRKNNIRCCVKIINDKLTIEYGYDQSKTIKDKIQNIISECNIQDVSICGSVSGGNLIARIFGGPKYY